MTDLSWNEDHGQALRSRRRQRGLTQEALAEAAEVAVATIKNLERGARQPRSSTLQLIAKALRCSADELQGGRPMPSIAVLPFKNLNADEEQEYFCDGLAEELINALAHLPGLKVAARTSSFYFKNKDVDLGAIGEALGVHHVLEGSIQRSGDQLRIMAQLIQIDDGFHVWSERFDRQFTEIFSIQDEIVASVTRKLRIELLEDKGPTLVKPPTKDLVAYEFYLKGSYLVMQANPTSFDQALECLQQAIELDPNFALAHACISAAYIFQVGWAQAGARELVPMARTAAERALAIDESLGLAHGMLAATKQILDWDWAGAGRAYDRALYLDPTNTLVREAHATYLMATHGLDEAIEESRRAVELDPLSASAAHNLGFRLLLGSRIDEAIAVHQKVLRLEPHRGLAHITMGSCLLHAANFHNEEAIQQVRRGVELSNRHPFAMAAAASVFASAGLLAEASSLLDELKIRRRGGEYVSPFQVARANAVLENINEAFVWLRVALDEHDVLLYYILADMRLDGFQSDTRYWEAVETVGLTPYATQHGRLEDVGTQEPDRAPETEDRGP